MKKLRTLIALIAMLCCSIASAHDFEVDGIYYNTLTAAEVEVTFRGLSQYDYSEYAGKVEIPECVTYNGKTYLVTSIGEVAFACCTGLTSITIPNSVTSIGGSAFLGCSGLTSINIPNSVTSIAGGAFWDCTGLASINIPNSVTSIGDGAFYGCTGLTSIYIPNSVTSIGGSAFQVCSGLTSITIPNSVTSIGGCAFYGCTGLTSIYIPNSVTSIGGSAFYGCTGLASITIPNSVTSIGGSAFYGCTDLKIVINFSSLDILRGKSTHGYVAYYADKVITADDQIGDFYFKDMVLVAYTGNDKEIKLPDNYNGGNYAIGFDAFRGCAGLTSITIPNSVTSIGFDAFRGCTGLASITIPNSVTSIGNDAFRGCTGLTSINIPNSVTSIGRAAFSGCTGLTSITIPNSVTSIGFDAFFGCTGLASITIPNSVTSIGDGAFSGCTGLTSITIPNSVTSIGYGAFYGCTGLASITIPNSVTSIGDYTFHYCNSLSEIYSNMKDPCACPSPSVGSPTLYVPAGTADKYIAQGWDEWASEIVEVEIEISSTLSVSDVKVTHGASAILPVSMENEESVTAFQFEVSLPEGASLVGCELTDRKGDHTLSFSELPSGNYQIVAISLTSKAFKDSEGALVNLQLATEKEMEAGEYNVTVKNIELTTTDEDALRPADCTAKLTVTDVMVGDSNGDGKISITDAVAIVNYILNKPSSSFAVEAADVNMDAKVTITDAVAIVNKILAGTTEAKSRAADMQLDPQ